VFGLLRSRGMTVSRVSKTTVGRVGSGLSGDGLKSHERDVLAARQLCCDRM